MPRGQVDGSFLTLGPDSGSSAPPRTRIAGWAAPTWTHSPGVHSGPLLAPPPAPSRPGAPGPAPCPAGRGLRAAATPARAGSGGRGSDRGSRRSPGRLRRRPSPDARRGWTPFATSGRSPARRRRPRPPRPQPASSRLALLPPASRRRPRVLSRRRGEPVRSASAGQVSVAAVWPGRPGRAEGAGPAAAAAAAASAGGWRRRRARLSPPAGRAAQGRAPPPAAPAAAAAAADKAPEVGSRAGGPRLRLRAACGVRLRPAKPGPLAPPLLSALLRGWVSGTRIVQQV